MDTITTLFILPGETNPIFHLLGKTLWPIIVFKIFVVAILWYWYNVNKYEKPSTYYLLLSILIYGSIALAIAQYGNIKAMLNPSYVEWVSEFSTEEKVKDYFTFMSFVYIIPLVFNMITFWIYQKSYHKVYISKKFYKKQGWWKVW
jgi:hypothetical protein